MSLSLPCARHFPYTPNPAADRFNSQGRLNGSLLNLALEVLALDQVRDVVLVFLALFLALGGLLLLQVLVALGQLAQRRQAVRAQLVQDARDELGQLLLLAVAVDSEGVGGDGGVDCIWIRVC